jgi:hypothetical protein
VTQRIQIPVLEDGPATGPSAPPVPIGGPRTEGPPPPFWTTKRAIGAAVGGVGLVGIAVGAALGALTLSKTNQAKSQGHCNESLTVCDSIGLQMDQAAAGTAHGSTVAFAVGGAAVATGIVLLAIGGSPNPQTGLRWSVGPVAGLEMTGALVRGGW